MFCPKCGREMGGAERFCSKCGAARPGSGGGGAARGPASTGQQALRMVLPVDRSGWAVAAGYLGLIGGLGIPVGIIAIWHLRRHPEKLGWGRAVFGIVAGVAWIGLWCWIFAGGGG